MHLFEDKRSTCIQIRGLIEKNILMAAGINQFPERDISVFISYKNHDGYVELHRTRNGDVRLEYAKMEGYGIELSPENDDFDGITHKYLRSILAQIKSIGEYLEIVLDNDKNLLQVEYDIFQSE